MTNKKPKANAKTNQIRILLSDKELEQFNYCCDFFNLSRPALLRQWIDKAYKIAKKKG